MNKKSILTVITSLLIITIAHADSIWQVNNESAFNEGIYNNTFFNDTLRAVQLNLSYSSGNYTSKVLDSSGTSKWNNITWWSGYGYELPHNKSSEDYIVNPMNMSDNVLLMHLNEASGVIIDYSGEGNNGTTGGDVTYNATGKLNTALDFDGDGDYINLKSNATLDDVWIEFATLSVWIYPGSDGESDTGRIMDKDGYSILYVREDNGTHVKLSFVRYFFTQAGIWTTGLIIPLNEWTHIVIDYNSSSILNSPHLYLNGASRSIPQVQAPIGARLSDAAEDYMIGSRGDGLRSFNGTIDEFALFNRQLTATEALNLYERGIMKLNLTVRSCDDATCTGDSWNETYIKAPQNLTVSNNRYFQYRADFYTDNGSPELYNITTYYTRIYAVEIENSTYSTYILGGEYNTFTWDTNFLADTRIRVWNNLISYDDTNIITGSRTSHSINTDTLVYVGVYNFNITSKNNSASSDSITGIFEVRETIRELVTIKKVTKKKETEIHYIPAPPLILFQAITLIAIILFFAGIYYYISKKV